MFNKNETLALVRKLQNTIALHHEELIRLKENLERLRKPAMGKSKEDSTVKSPHIF